MRTFLAVSATALLFVLVVAWWRYSSLFPRQSHEVVRLDADKRRALTILRDETKFEPNNYPPLGYTGIATPEDGIIARTAVNGAISAILAHGDGPIEASMVSDVIGEEMQRVDQLDTEDRDRTADYMVEIWYTLGFKGATGQFAYGAAFQIPEGYSEPLPPGWKSPTEPRQADRR